MPLYEYRCTKCGNLMEVLQKFSDPPKRRCPECSGKLEKLISRTSFQLKGGGWYAQGYSSSSSSGSKKKSNGSGGASSGAGDSSASGGSSEKGDSGRSLETSAATA